MARGSPAPGALHWGGYAAPAFASLRALVSLFPPSDTSLHPPRGRRGCARRGLPTWPPRLRLCFPPRRDAATGPFPRGRAREAPRGRHGRWTGSGKCGFHAAGPVAWENERGGGERSVTLVRALETRTNPATESEAEFLAHLMILLPLCGREHRWETNPACAAQRRVPWGRLPCLSAGPRTCTRPRLSPKYNAWSLRRESGDALKSLIFFPFKTIRAGHTKNGLQRV